MRAPQNLFDLSWGQWKDSAAIGVDVNGAERGNDADAGQAEIDIEAPTQKVPHYQAWVVREQRHRHLAAEIAIGAPPRQRR